MEDKTPNPARGHIDDTASPDALAIRVRGLVNRFGDQLVHDHLDHGTWKAARTTFEALDPEEEGLRAFRFTALQRSLLKPTESSFPGDPPPATFNRHASAHGVSGTQYTQLNSLTANMLVASFARELSSIYALVDEQAARSGQ